MFLKTFNGTQALVLKEIYIPTSAKVISTGSTQGVTSQMLNIM